MSTISSLRRVSCFFFFQAEDGIRDTSVTGVQTCALPISRRCCPQGTRRSGSRHPGVLRARLRREEPTRATGQARDRPARSEERRVGKECRTRRAPYDKKKKENEKRVMYGKRVLRSTATYT